ncbi:hypothetical protein [Aureivirga sp. CE67]|uniref:hypothetical protein n=1 Tax=Aureivirga sp. CE67 TaxID=1788983 RepID=UPI0018CA6088|nr:hypothetical protein [Aureivirga sp. CE67]
MKTKFTLVLLLFVSILLTNCTKEDESYEQGEVTPDTETLLRSNHRANVAFHHAPIHIQDVDRTGKYSLGGVSDYVTAVDFDGDWNSSNNWNNISTASQAKAVCYYSVSETSTHYYVVYSFFHPRDWTDNFFLYSLDQHENDLEGILHIIKKDGSTYGTLQGIVTVFHLNFYSFKPSGSPLTNGNEDIDGICDTEYYAGSYRAITSQEAKGHGIKTYPTLKPGGSDYVKYYPSLTTSEYPSSPYDQHVKYKLVDIFEPNGFWDHRWNSQFLINGAYFPNTKTSNGQANAPWNWNDGNDNVGTGIIATDPAALTNDYFNNLGTFSSSYVYNPYQ